MTLELTSAQFGGEAAELFTAALNPVTQSVNLSDKTAR